MNVLFVVPYVPSKIRVRPYSWIRYLHRLGHRITLFTVCTSRDDHQALQELQGYCERIHQVELPSWRSMINCGGQQQVELAFDEVDHDLFQLAFVHLPMTDSYPGFRHDPRLSLIGDGSACRRSGCERRRSGRRD